ncbi:hypothetical protein [Gordonia tangerina]|uniref:FHA domain-containing protein n=1 Tax=Gordonia tangerina TaxID=2911060 RepID=A0ABS9DDL4_9ACTN|nr:hypothetical protein [Gordonia tangerina]MCF3937309.1 hypothetical protein [Gordonia tangerina]
MTDDSTDDDRSVDATTDFDARPIDRSVLADVSAQQNALAIPPELPFVVIDVRPGGLRVGLADPRLEAVIGERTAAGIRPDVLDQLLADHLVSTGRVAEPTGDEWTAELLTLAARARARLATADATFIMGREHVRFFRVAQRDLDEATASLADEVVRLCDEVATTTTESVRSVVLAPGHQTWPGLLTALAARTPWPVLAIGTAVDAGPRSRHDAHDEVGESVVERPAGPMPSEAIRAQLIDSVATEFPHSDGGSEAVDAELLGADTVSPESVTPEPIPAESVAPETIPAESVAPETIPAESVAAESVAAEPADAEPVAQPTQSGDFPVAWIDDVLTPITEPIAVVTATHDRHGHRPDDVAARAGQPPSPHGEPERSTAGDPYLLDAPATLDDPAPRTVTDVPSPPPGGYDPRDWSLEPAAAVPSVPAGKSRPRMPTRLLVGVGAAGVVAAIAVTVAFAASGDGDPAERPTASSAASHTTDAPTPTYADPADVVDAGVAAARYTPPPPPPPSTTTSEPTQQQQNQPRPRPRPRQRVIPNPIPGLPPIILPG